MLESYMNFGQNTIFCRHNAISGDTPSILMIHGLGESGLSFLEILDDVRFAGFNIVIPDLLGYGRSSRSLSHNYAFDLHLDYLWRVIDHFALEKITVVGHSMGGDLGTLLCRQQELREEFPKPNSDRKGKIQRFLNIEGSLTDSDRFISGQAVEAAGEDRFRDWFQWDFMYRQVYGTWSPRWLFGRRYLASLHFCDPAAFFQNAREIFERSGGDAAEPIGDLYRGLTVPKLFVFGQESLSCESKLFLFRHGLKSSPIEGSHHWPMIDCSDVFYDLLLRFTKGKNAGQVTEEPRCDKPAKRHHQVARVILKNVHEYDDSDVKRTLKDENAPWLIREARKAQDEFLFGKYEGKKIRIADIGCGDGRHAERFARGGCLSYHGYEISPAMAELARARCARFEEVLILEGDVYDVTLASDSYDVIWCLYFTPGNLRKSLEYVSDYTDAYIEENTFFIDVVRRFFNALATGGSLYLTVYKDTPQAEEAQRSFYWRTDQFVLTDFGSRFVATDKGFWSRRWKRECLLKQLVKADIPESGVTFKDLNEIAWLVEARK